MNLLFILEDMNKLFRRISDKISTLTGKALTFMLAVLLIITWLVSGPIFNYSTFWHLTFDVTVTIITFLMVFLIQNTQNRDSKTIHLKLDELIKVTQKANNKLIEIEEDSDDEIDALEEDFKRIKEQIKDL